MARLDWLASKGNGYWTQLYTTCACLHATLIAYMLHLWKFQTLVHSCEV